MDMYGCRAVTVGSDHMKLTATGYSLITAGCGCLTIRGDGRRSIMAGGTTTMCTVGIGSLMKNGVLPGFHGEGPPDTMVGHRYAPASASALLLAAPIKNKTTVGYLFVTGILHSVTLVAVISIEAGILRSSEVPR